MSELINAEGAEGQETAVQAASAGAAPEAPASEPQAPEAQAPEAQPSESRPALSPDQMLELSAEGQRMLGQGRAREAFDRAESLLAGDPAFLPALALKGDALEKLGDIPAALAAYERILEIKPDSAMDRIRATHLRRRAALEDLDVEEAPTHARAILAAAAAVVLFLAVTMGAYFLSQGPKKVQVASKDPEPAYTNFQAPAPVPTGPSGQQSGVQNPVVKPEENEGVMNGEAGYSPPRRSSGSRALVQNPSLEGEVQPVSPVISNPTARPIGGEQPSAPVAAPPGGGANGAAGGSRAVPDEPDRIAVNPRRSNPGIVDIRPSGGEAKPVSGGSAPVDPDEADARQSAEALIRVARDAYIRADWNRAADAYEKALRMGASRGSTNQRLAQCYERLGRRQEAISSYEKAIAAYQSQLAGGENDRVSAALESSRQALKVLRGS